MNDIKIFNNEEFGDIRTVTIDGEPWFVGKDVADILGYQNGSRDINRHVDEEDRHKVMLFDGNQDKETIIINESGLYSLILSSKMPNAKKFKHWITSEVLPSIRKTGQYQMPNLSKEMQAIVLLDTRTVQMEKRMDKLEFDIPMYGSEADELSNHVKRKGVQILGGKKSEAYRDSNIHSKVYRDIYDQVKREFDLYGEDGKPKSYKSLKRKYIYEAHECVDCYEAPIYIKEMIQDVNAQMSLTE